jgi:hypothetical protein
MSLDPMPLKGFEGVKLAKQVLRRTRGNSTVVLETYLIRD